MNVCKMCSLYNDILYPRPLCEVSAHLNGLVKKKVSLRKDDVLMFQCVAYLILYMIHSFLQAAFDVYMHVFLPRLMLMSDSSPQTMLNSHTEAF